MIVTIQREDLQSALQLALQVVPSRPSRPVLGNFLVSTTGSCMIIKAFDESIGIVQTVPADGKLEPSQLCVPAQLFADTVAKQPRGCELKLEFIENNLIIKRGRSRTTMAAAADVDYPLIETAAGPAISINTDSFTRALQQALFSASKDETKPILTGINMAGNRIASTDGHRLSVVTLDDVIETPTTLPSKALRLVSKVSQNQLLPEIKMFQGDGFVTFKIDSVEIYTRVINGVYPDYLQLIPQKLERTIGIQRLELIQCLERVMVIAEKAHDVVTLRFDHEGLSITSDALEAGNTQEFLDCQGLEFEITFNGKYLLEALKYMNSDVIYLGMNTPTSPALLTDEGYTHLIMPIQKRS